MVCLGCDLFLYHHQHLPGCLLPPNIISCSVVLWLGRFFASAFDIDHRLLKCALPWNEMFLDCCLPLTAVDDVDDVYATRSQ